jgi:DNA-binding GntR family transcriptional regulator
LNKQKTDDEEGSGPAAKLWPIAAGGGSRESGDAHRWLRSAIIRGDLAAGQIVTQEELTQRVGTSRTPIREAVRRLQQEGLVVSQANKRVQIADFSIADLEDLYTLRISVDAIAVRLTVESLAPENLAELWGLIAQMDHFAHSEDFDRLEIPHRKFHQRLSEGVGGRMTRLLSELFDQSDRYRRAFSSHIPGGYWPRRHIEHRQILEAAESGDSSMAVRLTAEHYGRSVLEEMRVIDPDYVPESLYTVLREAGGVAEPQSLLEPMPVRRKKAG